MNINLKLPNELQEKIEKIANENLTESVEELLRDDDELKRLIHDTIKGQLKTAALKVLQSDTLRTKMAQKIYPVVYKTLGLEE